MDLIHRISSATLDYSGCPVPYDRTIASWRLFGVWFATIVSLGLINIGILLAKEMSFRDAALAILVAQSIVAILFAASAWIGATTRMTIGMMVQIALGRRGAIPLLLAIAAASIGWFAFQLEVFAKAAIAALEIEHTPATEMAFIGFGGIVMCSTAVIGFRAIERLSQAATPALLILVAWPLMQSWFHDPGVLGDSLAGKGVEYSLAWTDVLVPMISGPALGLLVVPDVARYGRSPRGAAVATGLSFFLGGGVIFLLAFALGRLAPSESIAQVLPALGMGVLGLSLLLLAAWTTNDSNIYFASLAVAIAVRSSTKWKIAVACGFLGTGAAFLGISESFISWLNLIGNVFYPAAAVFLLDYAFRRQLYDGAPPPAGTRTTNVLAWLLGSSLAILATEFSVVRSFPVGVPLVDALVVTVLTYLIGSYVVPRIRGQRPRGAASL